MEQYNWKKELKRTGLDFLHNLYSIICATLVVVILLYFEPDKSFKVLQWITDIKDWSISIVFFTGIAVWGHILRYIITFIFKVIFFILKRCKKLNINQ